MDNIKLFRWISLIPVFFTIIFLSDWIVRFSFWIIRLPLIIFEKIFKFNISPVGYFMNNMTEYLFKLNSIETIIIFLTGLFTGYNIIYIITLIIPKNNIKEKVKILITIYLTLLFSLTFIFIINGIIGESFLLATSIIIGIIYGFYSIKNENKQIILKYENFIKNNIKIIFITTFLFSGFLLLFLF